MSMISQVRAGEESGRLFQVGRSASESLSSKQGPYTHRASFQMLWKYSSGGGWVIVRDMAEKISVWYGGSAQTT